MTETVEPEESAAAPSVLGSVGIMLTSAMSAQTGAAMGAHAFPIIGPAGVVAIRQLVAVSVLLPTARPPLHRMTWSQWWPVILLAVHAPISELVQWRFIPYRSGDPLDLAADLLGIAVGVGVAELVRRRVLAPDADHAPVE